MDLKPGRMPSVAKEQILEIIREHASELFTNKNAVINRRHEIWTKMSNKVQNKLAPVTFYNIVTNNKYNIRTELTAPADVSLNSTCSKSGNNTLDTSRECNTSCDKELRENGEFPFKFSMNFEELDSLIQVVYYAKKKGEAKTTKKQVFKPYKWNQSSQIKFGSQRKESVVITF